MVIFADFAKFNKNLVDNDTALQIQVKAIQAKPKQVEIKARNRFLNFWKRVKND